ncbi:MAG: hypothetical protein FWG42_06645, partial [Clostridiales bacterium]|nr:hypothetical protein [Clostridiales bacterium]
MLRNIKTTKSALIWVLVLSLVLPLGAGGAAYAGSEDAGLTVDDIASIQAYTDLTFYGQGLVEVEVVYKDGVELGSVTKDTYIIEDRGSMNPDFGLVKIKGVSVNGQTVTLEIYDDTCAIATNALIYGGAGATGSRGRNAFGIYPTGAWYRGVDGAIYYGSADSAEYKRNATGMGYQTRACLELKLRHAGEDAAKAACLADDKGAYNASGLWKKTVDRKFGAGGFLSFEEAGIKVPSTSATATDGTGDDFVKGWVYVPESYTGDKATPIVFTLHGSGTSYWKLPDGTNNEGTAITYDASLTSWMDKGVFIVGIHDRSSSTQGGPDYDYVTDDVRVMKHFIDNYNIDTGKIIIHGNSRGTNASSEVIRALAGRPYNGPHLRGALLDKKVYNFNIGVFLCHNGSLGTSWTADDRDAVAATGLRAWAIDGEQDSNNITNAANYAQSLKRAGYDDAWIEDNLRLTGLSSEMFYYWGETDHSATRLSYWYFADEPFYGPDYEIVGGKLVYNSKLEPGDTYTLLARGAAATSNKVGYEYTVYADALQEWALKDATALVPVDLAGVSAPAAKNGESNQQPLNGYFKASLPAPYGDREIRYYIPGTAVIRPYFHFIAVPDGVDVDRFVIQSGWKRIADETGECLFMLVPKEGKWGSAAGEKDYIAAARAYHQGGGASFFTTFGIYYLTGYKEGAAPLEAWAAENPNLVIAQSYVGGASAGAATLNAAGAASFGWLHMSDGDQNRFLMEDGIRVKQKILIGMADRLKNILNPGLAGYEGLLTKGDMPVPTWLVNAGGGDSLAYWKKVNRATSAVADSSLSSFGGSDVTAGDVFAQKEDTWPTEYAGKISKTTSIATGADTGVYAFTRALRDAMALYTRYDSTISYGNALTYRLDYTAVQVDRFTSPSKAAGGKVSGKDLNGIDVEADISFRLLTTSAGLSDMLLYVPETAGDKDIPVVIVNHGASQTAHLFFDSTAWWQTAAAEGFALVFTTRTTQGSGGRAPESLTLFDSIYSCLVSDGRFDMTRVYTTGQSAGGSLTATYSVQKTDYLAASYATNAGNPSPESGGKPIPTGMFIGDGNSSNRGLPGFIADTSYPEDETANRVRSTAAAAAGADIYWDNGTATPGATTGFYRWVAYYTDANGLNSSNLSSLVRYRDGNSLNGGTNKDDGTLAEWGTNNARIRTFTWNNDFGIPLMEYSYSLFNAHNNRQSYSPVIWDFMKHFSVVDNGDGTVTRYYSESAFAKDDAVVTFPDILRLSLGADVESDIAKDVEFTMSVSNAKNLLNIEVEFVVDGDMLSGKGIVPLNGFTVMNDVFWSHAGGNLWKGTATLAYPAGANEGLTAIGPVEIAKFIYAPRAAGDATMKVTTAKAAGLRGDTTRYIDVIIAAEEATTNIDQRVFSKYDLNRDNVVDALDLGIMLLYCGFDKDSPDWGTLVKVNDSKGKPVT